MHYISWRAEVERTRAASCTEATPASRALGCDLQTGSVPLAAGFEAAQDKRLLLEGSCQKTTHTNAAVPLTPLTPCTRALQVLCKQRLKLKC